MLTKVDLVNSFVGCVICANVNDCKLIELDVVILRLFIKPIKSSRTFALEFKSVLN